MANDDNFEWQTILDFKEAGTHWQIGVFTELMDDGNDRIFAGVKNVETDTISYFDYTLINREENELVGVVLKNHPETDPTELQDLSQSVRFRMTQVLEYLAQNSGLKVTDELSDRLTAPDEEMAERAAQSKPESESGKEKPLYRSQYPTAPNTPLDETEVEIFAALSDDIDAEANKLAQEHFKEIVSRENFFQQFSKSNAALDRLKVYQDAELDLLTQQQAAEAQAAKDAKGTEFDPANNNDTGLHVVRFQQRKAAGGEHQR